MKFAVEVFSFNEVLSILKEERDEESHYDEILHTMYSKGENGKDWLLTELLNNHIYNFEPIDGNTRLLLELDSAPYFYYVDSPYYRGVLIDKKVVKELVEEIL